MKKICALLSLLLLFATFPVSAAADTIAADYCGDSVLNVFFDAQTVSAQSLNARLSVDKTAESEKISDRGAPVRYLLLLDVSQSVKSYRSQIKKFVSELYDANDAENINVRYTLACYGENFISPESDSYPKDTASKKALTDAIGKISFSDTKTDTYKALSEALEYAQTVFLPEKGELMNIVLITDGVLTTDGELDYNPADSVSVDRLIKSYDSSRNILLHVYCPGEGLEDRIGEVASAGRGVRCSERKGKAAAQEVADYVNGLHVFKFDFGSATALSASIPQSMVVEMSIPEIDFKASIANIPHLGSDASYNYSYNYTDIFDFDDEENAQAEDEENTQGEPEAEAEGENESQDENQGEGQGSDYEASQGYSASASGNESGKSHNMVLIFAIVVAAIILAAIIVVMMYIGINNRKSKPAPGAIFMKLEMIFGECIPSETEFYLSDELIIGRGRSCDLTLKSDELDIKNTRIFINNGFIYIEDMGSKNGTLLGGMKLHAPNRLRTGDEISIGSVRFRFKF